jgi:hypothetical protein
MYCHDSNSLVTKQTKKQTNLHQRSDSRVLCAYILVRGPEAGDGQSTSARTARPAHRSTMTGAGGGIVGRSHRLGRRVLVATLKATMMVPAIILWRERKSLNHGWRTGSQARKCTSIRSYAGPAEDCMGEVPASRAAATSSRSDVPEEGKMAMSPTRT